MTKYLYLIFCDKDLTCVIAKYLLQLLCHTSSLNKVYCNNPEYWDRKARANNVDPDQMLQIEVLIRVKILGQVR